MLDGMPVAIPNIDILYGGRVEKGILYFSFNDTIYSLRLKLTIPYIFLWVEKVGFVMGLRLK